MGRKRRPKAVKVELIRPDAKVQPKGDPYRLLARLIDAHHSHLANARIALAWHMGWKANPDGRLQLGKAKKCGDLEREFHAYDFVILLNRQVWNRVDFAEGQILALLDHELCHCEVRRGKDGEVLEDERGRTLWRIRKHDVEEFQEVLARHGCWKKDLEAFVRQAVSHERSLFADVRPGRPRRRGIGRRMPTRRVGRGA